MVADYLRRHGPFEPHRLPLDEMEYTTMPAVAAKLEKRWKKMTADEAAEHHPRQRPQVDAGPGRRAEGRRRPQALDTSATNEAPPNGGASCCLVCVQTRALRSSSSGRSLPCRRTRGSSCRRAGRPATTSGRSA